RRMSLSSRPQCRTGLVVLWARVRGRLFAGLPGFIGERSGDLVEEVLLAVVADEDGVALAVVVVDVDGLDVVLGLHEEVDGLFICFGRVDYIAQAIGGEGAAVDGDELLTGRELGLIGRAAPANVRDRAF